MAGLSVKTHIAASQERVFERATDFADAARVISGISKMEMITEGPVGKGTRFRETRVMFGKKATEVMEVTDFEPPHRYALGCENHGCRYHSEFRMVPNGSGTDVEMTFEAFPRTLVAKIMSFVMRPMMKSVAKHCTQDLYDLKAAIEKG